MSEHEQLSPSQVLETVNFFSRQKEDAEALRAINQAIAYAFARKDYGFVNAVIAGIDVRRFDRSFTLEVAKSTFRERGRLPAWQRYTEGLAAYFIERGDQDVHRAMRGLLIAGTLKGMPA